MKKSKQIKLFFLSVLITISWNAVSQETLNFKKKTNEFQFGFSTLGIKEQLINKAIQKGVGLSLGFSKTKETLKTYQRFEFIINTTFPKSKYESEANSFSSQATLSYRSLFKINKEDTKFNLFLGGLASFETQIEFFENWDKNHYYWLTTYALGLDIRCEYQTTSNANLSLEGSMPIFAFSSRPPSDVTTVQDRSEFWKIISRIHDNMQFSLPSRHFAFNLELAYKFKADTKFSPTIFWKLNYISNDLPSSKKIKQINNVFGMKFHI